MKPSLISWVVITNLTLHSLSYGMQPAQQTKWEQIKRFAQKHKAQIIAGGIAVVATMLAGGTYAYADARTEKAIAKAGIKKRSLEYTAARDILLTYGLLGADWGIEEMVKREDADKLAVMVTSDVGNALAIFWGISHKKLIARFAAKGIGNVVRQGAAKVKEAVQDVKKELKQGVQEVKGFFNKYF